MREKPLAGEDPEKVERESWKWSRRGKLECGYRLGF